MTEFLLQAWLITKLAPLAIVVGLIVIGLPLLFLFSWLDVRKKTRRN